MSWRRYLFRVPRQNFFGAENAVVGNVGVALITVRLIGRAALVAHPLVPSTLAPAAHARPMPPTKTATPATLSWLPWSGWLRMLARTGPGMIVGKVARIVSAMVPVHPSRGDLRNGSGDHGGGIISEGWRGSSPG
jgi:hypothetical protein